MGSEREAWSSDGLSVWVRHSSLTGALSVTVWGKGKSYMILVDLQNDTVFLDSNLVKTDQNFRYRTSVTWLGSTQQGTFLTATKTYKYSEVYNIYFCIIFATNLLKYAE